MDWLETNRAHWDERVPIHVASDFYDVDAFRAGRSSLRDFEITELGDVTGRRLVHLQCHFGLDALSWARRGATVTGVDFSAPAIDAARRLAQEIRATDAHFVVSDVYRAAEALDGQTYDIVYTGLGALCWLPDLTRWARVVNSLLAPGGTLYLAEFHPVTDMLGDDGRTIELDYFSPDPQIWDEPGSYADFSAPTEHNRSVGWLHPLGEVVSAVAGSGLHIDFLHEHDTTLFARYAVLKRLDDQRFGFPAGHPRIPLMYSLRARRA
ncbi:class I SAM-dependent methyltransferase [Mycobacterium sp.]|uniref:class I SAM-dependent methyltransferase n=1 Tax=Mycobacterium sp. TaxID=1785 RepID=UPI002B8CCAE8|nr:class I SAM-dependent methyltransferase [Mycobacterium sp.]HTQ20006.1 class I SAM-dependent methyltransferase [Mycobacterium sp.]